MKRRKPVLIILTPLLLLITSIRIVSASAGATLSISPGQGTFEVASTFDLSFFLNTAQKSINAVKLDIEFPADKLQVVSPTTGKSFISIWASYPEFSNSEGTITMQGGLPNPGISSDAALVSTITFRATAPGRATIRIKNSSMVLENNGQGTNIAANFGTAEIEITLPQSQGPKISSLTHSDPNKWYKDNNVTVSWELPSELQSLASDIGYSWVFDQDPKGNPDNTVDTQGHTATITDLASGVWYFHVKSLIQSSWGQPSHFVIRIDNTPPAQFAPEVTPTFGDDSVRRSVQFASSDQHSGISHYQVKIESLSGSTINGSFFIEQTSPWQLEPLPAGTYRITVRAFDHAGNWTDSTVEFSTQLNLVQLISQRGFTLLGVYVPFWMIAVLILVIFLLLAYRRRRNRRSAENIRKYLVELKQELETEQQNLNKELAENDQIEDMLQNTAAIPTAEKPADKAKV